MNRWNRSRASSPLTARLADVAARLGIGLPADADSETIVASLDAAVTRMCREREQLGNQLARYRDAIAEAPVALVLVEENGSELIRSKAADEWLRGGAAAPVPDAVLHELVRKAAAGDGTRHDVVEVFGPPRRTLSMTAVPVRAGTEPSAVLVLFEDATQWRRAELARRDFVTNISHELRTPVGAIALLAETLAGEDDRDTAQRLARRLEGEASRLATTLQDVLALSRLEAAGPGDREPINLSELARFCMARFRASADVAGIELRDAAMATDVVVTADRSLLTTAIDNLLDNAVKYSESGASIEVAVQRAAGGDVAELAVTDHGIGIPLRERQRIFERFYRVDRARSRETGGSGLGLAIVRHVAVVHDGSVEVESLEGEGSTFTLRLPLAPAGAALLGRDLDVAAS